jgi:PAS domain S-box-containing protein
MRLLELDTLSERELKVLELAIEGLTDQQIGARIGIRTTTVNSYWVRIRGKLGHFSRTELVSRVLRQRSMYGDAVSTQKIESLENKLSEMRTAQVPAGVAALAKAAIECCPEAMLVTDSEGMIVFASHRLGQLFGLDLSELMGTDLRSLVQPLDGVCNPSRHIHNDGGSTRLGQKTPLYGRRKDGVQFRLFLVLAKSPGEPGIWSCIIRPFHEEVDSALERAAVIMADLS